MKAITINNIRVDKVNKTDKIVIMHDGKTTTATLYREDGSKEKATAKCSPEDTFDFNVGAKLAMERLMEKVKPEEKKGNVKFKTGDYAKIIAKKHGHGFAIGTIVKLEKGTNDYRATSDSDFWWVRDDELEAYTPPKFYNGKVVCIANRYGTSIPIGGFTVGKVYEVVDGRITTNDGYTSTEYKTLRGLCGGMGNEFIPYVE